MRFEELAKYLEKLQTTASRNDMTVILAQLFKTATADDARLIAYLSQGRIGPGYASPDMGVADKSMVKALGEQASTLFKSKGDLGLVAQELVTKKQSTLTIEEVFMRLEEIASVSGSGSQEKKQTQIKELIADLDSLSAKFVVRIILGKLRTGFSDMTILDSLSWMLTGDKSMRKVIEAIYNVRADLGEIAKLTKENKDLKKIKIDPKVGIPVLMAKGERATSATEIWERNGKCALEYKLDGLRIQAHIKRAGEQESIRLFSRGLEDVTHMYPDVVESLSKQIKKNCIVEGEMIGLGKNGKFLPFQETAQRKRKYDIAEMSSKIPLVIYLFDVLAIDGKSVMAEPNETRRKTLESLVQSGKGVILMPRITITSVAEIDDFFQKALQAGTEGIFAKKLDGPYQAGGRDFNWIKYKKSYDVKALSDTIDVVVMGYDYGQGKRSQFGIGDFLAGVYDPKTDGYLTVAKIGTGLTDDEWHRMAANLKSQISNLKPENYLVTKTMECDVWVRPKLVVEVQADEITRSPMHTAGVALRFPRLISWREKKPEDTTSIDEILKMLQTQRK